MGKKRKQLSQAEIWDDSALLQSWDEALAEYKLYHSIHARGERVEDVIKDVEAGAEDTAILEPPSSSRTAASAQPNGGMSVELEDGELEETGVEKITASADFGGDSQDIRTSEPIHTQMPLETINAPEQKEKPGMPHAVVNDAKDETLKNLMMSWYYAGYYTGLYEGQQQASQLAMK